MKRDEHGHAQGNASRGTSRIVESIPDKSRRSFLQIALAHGIAAPVALASLGSAKAATPAQGKPANPDSGRAGDVGAAGPNAPSKNRAGVIIRDFADPYLELLRLLREAAEIEHALMLQYLYSAFSIKARYQSLCWLWRADIDEPAGRGGSGNATFGRGQSPACRALQPPPSGPARFPYEPDIYPFPFMLEPISRRSLAKYAYTEGPASIFTISGQRSREDELFSSRVLKDIGGLDRPNHVGSLYRNIIDLLSECTGRPGFPLAPADVERWRSDLLVIMEEGEHDHFQFFRQVYEGRHPAFAKSGVENVWDVAPGHEAYPAHPLPENPTAFVGHPNQITSEDAHGIAWLSNLHYWLALCCLDFGYRHTDQNLRALALSQMMTALLPLATELPKRGAGVPFDTLSMGYALESTRSIVAGSFWLWPGKHRCSPRPSKRSCPWGYDQNNTNAVFELLGG